MYRCGVLVIYRPRLSPEIIGRVLGYGHDLLGPYVRVQNLSADHPIYHYGHELRVSVGADICRS